MKIAYYFKRLPTERHVKLKNGIYIYLVLGLLLGVFWDYCIRVHIQSPFVMVFITLFAMLYALTYDEKNSVRLVGTSAIVALFLSLPLLPIQIGVDPAHPIHFVNFLVAFPLFIYVGHCFHYAFHRDNSLVMQYRSLFEGVWNTMLLLFVAGFFSTMAMMLILLGAGIFKTVGNDYLWDLYYNNNHFRLILNMVLYFLGLGIGQQNSQVIYNLRFLLLKMMYYLFPILAFISVLYCVLYIVSFATGGEVPIEPLVILIPLSILGIIFFNAYFQDGEAENPAPEGLKLFLRIYRVILLVLVVLSVYKIMKDFNIETNMMLSLLTGLGFASSYGLTVLMEGEEEKKWIQKGNVITAWGFLLILFLLNLPYLPIDFTLRTGNSTAYNSMLSHW